MENVPIKEIVLVKNALHPTVNGEDGKPIQMGPTFVEITNKANLLDGEIVHKEIFILTPDNKTRATKKYNRYHDKQSLHYYNEDVFKNPHVEGIAQLTPIEGSKFVNETANYYIKRRSPIYPIKIKVPFAAIKDANLRRAILENTMRFVNRQKATAELYAETKPAEVQRMVERVQKMMQKDEYKKGKDAFVEERFTEFMKTLTKRLPDENSTVYCDFLIKEEKKKIDTLWNNMYGRVGEVMQPNYLKNQLKRVETIKKRAYDIPNKNLANLISIENAKSSLAKLNTPSINTVGKNNIENPNMKKLRHIKASTLKALTFKRNKAGPNTRLRGNTHFID